MERGVSRFPSCNGVKFRILFLICCAVTLGLIGVFSSLFVYFPPSARFSKIENPISPSEKSIERKLTLAQVGDSVGDSSGTLRSVEAAPNGRYSHEWIDSFVEKSNKFQISDLELSPKKETEDEIQTSNFSSIVQNRLIHFDLKGAPPKVYYLKDTILLAKTAGITGVIFEWEDTFPWRDALRNLSMTHGGYSIADVMDLIEFTESQGLEAIPLVQTFGHAEFALKGEEYAHLRETEGDPQSFCPSRNGTIELIRNMIEQVVELHGNSRFVHIGCDEVMNLRVCPLCTAHDETDDTFFLHHVTKVAQIVRDFGKIPLIWDDMLRSVSEVDLRDANIGSMVEVMVWVYANDVNRYISPDVWHKYSKIFPTIWVVGAYKGASGETATIPRFSSHYENVEQWLEVIRRESVKWDIGLGGFLLSGWSRYDHFAVLCELLPVSIPSLIYSALSLSTPDPSVDSVIRNRIFLPKWKQPKTLGSQRREKRSPYPGIPHPQTLRKIKLLTEPPYATDSKQDDTLTPQMILKHAIVWKEFNSILQCSRQRGSVSLQQLLADAELSFAVRCNWNGVIFFRSLFHLRELVNEVYKLESSIKYNRGWLTDYNINHRYTLPLRVNELIGPDVARLKRNLALKAKSIGTALKPIYRNEIILEWLEQNVWTPWKALNQLEIAGKKLKEVKYWGRRPLQTPAEIVSDLGLQPIQIWDKNEL